jgi:predicted metal-dependent peptidase
MADTTVVGRAGRWPQLKLDAVQERKWTETRTAVLWSQPAFADLWFAMMVDDNGKTAWFTDQVPIAACDDKYLYINPKTFFEYKLGERVFVCCHEIFHCMCEHCALLHNLTAKQVINYPDGTSLPFDEGQFQIAMDLVNNALLVESKVGDYNTDWHLSDKVTGSMSVLDSYRTIYKKQPKGGQDNKSGQGTGSGAGQTTPGSKGFDKHLKPGGGTGQTPNEAMSQRNDTAWKTAINAAVASARMQGNLPLGLERLFGKLMNPEVDWTELLRAAISKKLGQGGSSWSTLDPQLVVRGIGAPGRVAYGAGKIIVGVDTSGSIDQSMMDRFMSECAGILDDVNPKQLILIQCDAAIHEVVECSDSTDLKRKILGGGGTDFTPVFDHIEKEGDYPDMFIYFTDGLGKYPGKAPPYPVIWGNINKDHKYPWGDVVFVPLKKGMLL